ncbi:MAG: c-type cytochrome biosis protein CcmI [Pseudomonadota bacterium]|jgi:cytochrome c-type biogenesis protein CcmI
MTFSLFVMTALALLLFLSLVVIWPWLRPVHTSASLLDLNVTVFRERLAELDADYKADQIDLESYHAQKTELERQLLAITNDAPQLTGSHVPRLIVGMVFLWIPVLAVLAYVSLSDRAIIMQYWQAIDRHHIEAEQLLTGKIDAPSATSAKDGIGLLQALQANVYQHSTDPQRWMILAKAYTAAEAVEPALQSLARAYRLAPDDDNIGMTYAQMRFFSQQGKLDAEALQVVHHVLARNPQHEGAMMLMAMGTYRAADYPAAITWLTRLKTLRQAQPETASSNTLAQLDSAIASAQQALQASVESRLTLSIQVDPTLLAQVSSSDTLFVYARALTGPPMPYAAKKLDVVGLMQGKPLIVELSDSTTMMPERTISSARASQIPLVVGARISKSGNPLGAAGDLESLPVPVGNDHQFTVRIDQTR